MQRNLFKFRQNSQRKCRWTMKVNVNETCPQSIYTDHQHFLKTSFSPFSAWPAVVSSMNSPLLSCAMIVTCGHRMRRMSLYSTALHQPIRREQAFNSVVIQQSTFFKTNIFLLLDNLFTQDLDILGINFLFMYKCKNIN